MNERHYARETVVENVHSYCAIKLKEIVSRYREASYEEDSLSLSPTLSELI